MKNILISSAFLCCTLPAFAQIICSGRVTAASGGEGLPYVSIGIPGTSVGTVSGENGRFLLEIPENMASSDKDSIQFSMVGFVRKSLPLSALTAAAVEVQLEASTVQLREITVRPGNNRLIMLGKKKMKTRMVVNFAIAGKIDQNLGSEIGRRFRIKTASSLETFRFYISDNNFDTVRFRINVYDLKNGDPGDLLLKDNIIVEVTDKKTGWIKVDLTPFDLRADGSVVLGAEWVYGSPGGTILHLPIAMPVAGSKHFYKYGSRNKWKSFAGMSAAMVLEVRQ